MRSVIKIHSTIPQHGLKGAFEVLLAADWVLPADEDTTVRALIDRVYLEYRPDIERMNNFAFAHKMIPKCDMLVSFTGSDIQIRIFHDHIETLRELTGFFLKQFYDKLIAPSKYSFDVTEPITISEAHNNNILDVGVKAINRGDYIKKIIHDRYSELVFFCIVLMVTIATISYITWAFGTTAKQTLTYELVSKIIGPFLASSLLTVTNILIYYWRLRANTNIIWGIRLGKRD